MKIKGSPHHFSYVQKGEERQDALILPMVVVHSLLLCSKAPRLLCHAQELQTAGVSVAIVLCHPTLQRCAVYVAISVLIILLNDGRIL